MKQQPGHSPPLHIQAKDRHPMCVWHGTQRAVSPARVWAQHLWPQHPREIVPGTAVHSVSSHTPCHSNLKLGNTQHRSSLEFLPFVCQLLLGFQRHTLREARDLYAAPLPRLRTAILLRKAVRQRPRPPPPRRGHPHPQQVPPGTTLIGPSVTTL